MNTKKIVITGGPGTGKSSIIHQLQKMGYSCLEEISRQVTLQAREDGVEQMFLTQPLLFSERLLNGRVAQFNEANLSVEPYIFLDRGVHDVLAYMDFIGDEYPQTFTNVCESLVYDHVFILKPWKEIYKSDAVRYESFEEALKIHDCLVNMYERFNYTLIDVPFDTVENRADYILKEIKSL
ncbi:ATP-binding protein [Formosa sediminum]|uniref:ATP-binding protein n=1 Tax=Formosa sediminum TaxID=2594004 RepID=A0A516GUX3_9FLAO|nr:ATP-binding protein [Formosa sediminum]QDO95318.1 ATP-binding protein [Formosa sediminum]